MLFCKAIYLYEEGICLLSLLRSVILCLNLRGDGVSFFIGKETRDISTLQKTVQIRHDRPLDNSTCIKQETKDTDENCDRQADIIKQISGLKMYTHTATHTRTHIFKHTNTHTHISANLEYFGIFDEQHSVFALDAGPVEHLLQVVPEVGVATVVGDGQPVQVAPS